MESEKQLSSLVTAVTAAPKYRHINPDLIRRVGERELAARRNWKQAVKATRNKLHQIGGAYFEARVDYEAALVRLRATAVSLPEFRQTCLDIMRRHVSTRERLPILEEFYEATLAGLSDIRVVMDLACGLNPLARAWAPLSEPVEYIAYDIYADMMAFLGEFMGIAGMNGRAQTRDVIGHLPTEPADLILILKTLPVLEQLEKGAASRLLDGLNGRYLLVTFPSQSLGGRSKGMVQNYEAQFMSWIDGRNWQVTRFEFATELAFLVQTASPSIM
jgi:16S rRNA (guanine(1405)-N(7))-methyltransferase